MEVYNKSYVWKNFRIKLKNLRQDQIDRIVSQSHARRFLYNWALEYADKYYKETGKTPPYQEIAREFTRLKHSDPNFAWLNDKNYNVNTCRYAFKDLCSAYHNFLIGICRHPKYKERKSDSIRIASRSDCISVRGNKIFIPAVSCFHGDYIDCDNHNLPSGPNVEYTNARVKFDGVDYWLSISVKLYRPANFDMSTSDSEGIGIDVGIRTAAYLSNGKSYEAPHMKRLSTLDHRRRVIQSAVDRDVSRRLKESSSTRTKYYEIPKSNNQLKREKKLAKIKNKICNIYKNYYHNISRDIVNTMPKFIVLEDLNIPSMFNEAYGRRRFDTYESRMGTLSEYITYKAIELEIPVIYADRDYPSSQICSNCGNRHKVGASKIYKCPVCGIEIDRDLNASINLRDFGLRTLNGTNL